MAQRDLYRALASPPPASDVAALFFSSSTSSSLKASPHAVEDANNKTSPLLPLPSTPSATLDRYLSRFAQPYHAQLSGASPDRLFVLVSAALRKLCAADPSLRISKANDFKRKLSCCCRGQTDETFAIKLTTVSDSPVVVLELIVLSSSSCENNNNAWGELLGRLVAQPALKKHVASTCPQASASPVQQFKPLFTITA